MTRAAERSCCPFIWLSNEGEFEAGEVAGAGAVQWLVVP
ncbi:hypothetical protein ABIA35_008840, partial [Catenulispora sp. MAP12-49]